MEFISSNFTDRPLRIDIWTESIEIIKKNPIFGSGGGSFSEIFRYETGLWKGHSHNLPFELIVTTLFFRAFTRKSDNALPSSGFKYGP